MTWFKVDDSFPLHSKAVAAGPALALWVRAGAWSAQQLTDGFIPTHMLPMLGGAAGAKKLVSCGLWEMAKGGYQFHDWADYQPTKAEVEEKRRVRAAAGAAGGRRSGEVRGGSNSEANASASASADDEAKPEQDGSTAANPRPGPSRPGPSATPLGVQAPPPTKPSPGLEGVKAVVAAWVEGATEAGGDRPTKSLIARVGRQAKTLVDDECRPWPIVAEAARVAGRGGWVDIGHELLRQAAQRNPKPLAPITSTTDRKVAAVDDAVASLKARLSGSGGTPPMLGGAA